MIRFEKRILFSINQNKDYFTYTKLKNKKILFIENNITA